MKVTTHPMLMPAPVMFKASFELLSHIFLESKAGFAYMDVGKGREQERKLWTVRIGVAVKKGGE